jgi:hypothetical protein
MSTWTSFVKIWTVGNFEIITNFLTFLGLYHLLFSLKTVGVWLNHHLLANIWEIAVSILAENLNLGRSYMITTVKNQQVINILYPNKNPSLKRFYVFLESKTYLKKH